MISVIVPAYNIESYVARALDSILAQTYSDIEIIVVDDGSQDGTGAVIDDYAIQYPERVIALHIPNGGVTNARLTGVAHAKGEWIGFVDGDDEIEPDMYERLLRNAKIYGAQISHCGYQMCFPDGRVHFFHNTGYLAMQNKTTGLKELLSGSKIEPGLCNKLFHKTLLHSLFRDDVMDKSIKNNEDLLMNFYLFSAAETSVFDDWCPYHYIVRRESASRATLNEHKIYDPIRVRSIILEKCGHENREDARRAFLNTCIYTYCSLLMEQSTKIHCANVRKEILAYRAWISLLPKRTKVLAELIVYVPVLLKIAYPIYANNFQIKRYD